MSGIPTVSIDDTEAICESLERFSAVSLHAESCVSEFIIKNCFNACSDLHSLPESVKQMYAASRDGSLRGYYSGESVGESGSSIDRHYSSFEIGASEYGGISRNRVKDSLAAPNKWPTVPNFRSHVLAYIECVQSVGDKILARLADRKLIPEKVVSAAKQDRIGLIRLIQYGDYGDAADSLSPHTDYELLSVIISDSPGLEISSHSGEWFTVPSGPEVVTVLLGDLAEIATGGRLESALHRVRLDQPRRSLVYFYGLDLDFSFRDLAGWQPLDYYEVETVGDHIAPFLLVNFPHLQEVCVDASRWFPLPQHNPLKAKKILRLLPTSTSPDVGGKTVN